MSLQVGLRSRLVVALLAAAVVVAGCGGRSSTTTNATSTAAATVMRGVYVGRVAGTHAYIALVTNGSHLGGGYICDGYKLAVWLRPANLKGVQLPLDTKGAQAMLIN